MCNGGGVTCLPPTPVFLFKKQTTPLFSLSQKSYTFATKKCLYKFWEATSNPSMGHVQNTSQISIFTISQSTFTYPRNSHAQEKIVAVATNDSKGTVLRIDQRHVNQKQQAGVF